MRFSVIIGKASSLMLCQRQHQWWWSIGHRLRGFKDSIAISVFTIYLAFHGKALSFLHWDRLWFANHRHYSSSVVSPGGFSCRYASARIGSAYQIFASSFGRFFWYVAGFRWYPDLIHKFSLQRLFLFPSNIYSINNGKTRKTVYLLQFIIYFVDDILSFTLSFVMRTAK
jgi:hypothetical protein